MAVLSFPNRRCAASRMFVPHVLDFPLSPLLAAQGGCDRGIAADGNGSASGFASEVSAGGGVALRKTGTTILARRFLGGTMLFVDGRATRSPPLWGVYLRSDPSVILGQKWFATVVSNSKGLLPFTLLQRLAAGLAAVAELNQIESIAGFLQFRSWEDLLPPVIDDKREKAIPIANGTLWAVFGGHVAKVRVVEKMLAASNSADELRRARRPYLAQHGGVIISSEEILTIVGLGDDIKIEKRNVCAMGSGAVPAYCISQREMNQDACTGGTCHCYVLRQNGQDQAGKFEIVPQQVYRSRAI